VRIGKRVLRARVKGNLRITFGREPITAYAGLEVLRRFVVQVGLARRLRAALGGSSVDNDYGAASMTLAIVALLLLGGLRMAHVAFIGYDPVVLRFVGLRQLPDARTLSRWLKRFTGPTLLALETLVRDLVHDDIERRKLSSITLDLDGTVIRTGSKVEGAARGFNPHHPKDPSYYPLTLHIAELGQIVRIWNRPGNVNDSHNAVGFLRGALGDLRARFGRLPIRLRLDGAFFLPEMMSFLDGEAAVGWAVKVPLWKWLGVRDEIPRCRRWRRVDGYIDGFETALIMNRPGWPRALRVVVYRKRVRHESRKNFQLDLFSPDDGHYEYSAVATNLDLGVAALWHFMAGRGAHEKTLAELKDNVGLAVVPTNRRDANSAWQMLCVLTLNLVRSFLVETGADARPRTRKRTYGWKLASLRTLRFELLVHPARVMRPGGRCELRLSVPPPVRSKIDKALSALRQSPA